MLTANEQRQVVLEDPRQAPGGRPVVLDRTEASSVPGLASDYVSDLFASVDAGDSPVQQAFRDEVDINTIVKRYGVGRTQAVETMGVYADFSGILDYQDALERVAGANERFMSLPPEVRERFGNNPGRLIDAAQMYSEEEFARLMDPPKAESPVEPAESPAS